jgi:hypothetical protein
MRTFVKANRSARRDLDAVSPVVGTVMAVAIVIGLAGALFLLSKFFFQSQQTTPTPHVAFSRSGTTLQVVTAPTPALDWARDVRPSGTCAAHLQLAPTGGAAGPYPTSPGTQVSVGDKLTGCASGETLTLAHIATNRIMFATTF